MKPLQERKKDKLKVAINKQYAIINEAERMIKFFEKGYCQGELCTCEPKIIKVKPL